MVTTLKYGSVSIDEVIAAKNRLEANVYNVEAKKAKEVLRNCKWEIKTLCGVNGLCSAYRPNIATRIFVDKTVGIPMFTPSQFNELYPKPTKYLSVTTKTDLSKWYLKRGQLLLSCSGTIGKVAIVNKTLDNKLFSQNLIQLTPYDEQNLGFVYTYIKTSIGQSIIKSNNYGAVIQHIDPQHLDSVQIPYPDKEIRQKIHQLITRSFDLRDRSNELIDEAEKMLKKELNLPPIETLKPCFFKKRAGVRTYSVSLETLNNRLDASYHNPIVLSILDCLFDAGATIKRLDDKEISQKIIQAGRFKRNYVESDSDNGIVFLGGKQLLELDPSNKKYLSLTTHSNRVAKELFIHENMIAVTCSGTVGKVNIIPKHWENWTMSQHVMRIVPSSTDMAGYLYIWLQSDYGKALIERLVYGAVVDEIEEEHLAEVPIPLLKNIEAMQQINNLALEANKLRAEAYYQEQAAIKIMNEEVLYAREV